MDLEHGYFYTANSRLSLFASDTCWAIVFEKSGFANRSYEIQLELDFFENHLRNLEPGSHYHRFNYNSKYFTLVDGNAISEIEANVEQLSTSANQVKLRGKETAGVWSGKPTKTRRRYDSRKSKQGELDTQPY